MSQKLCLVWLFIAFSTHGQDILYNSFNNAKSNLTLKGAAQIDSNGLLKLTDLNAEDVIGHAFYPTPLRLKASPSSPVHSFSTVFSFSIVSKQQSSGGHGLAFFLAPDDHLSGALPSMYLGLTDESDDRQFFAVEFDTFYSPEFVDINDNHVGIDIDSLRSSASAPAGYYVDGNSTPQYLNLKSGETIFAWIDYDSGETRIDVRLSLSNHQPKRSILSLKVDLSYYLNEFMYAGFSASTGGLFQSSHYIMGWSFNVNKQAFPLQPSPPNTKEIRKRHVAQIVAAASASVVLILLVLLSSLWFCNYKKKKNKQASQENIKDIIEVESLHMEFNMIRAATHNFSTDRELGQGGFGHVYKGTLENGQDIAVKRLSINSGQGIAEFKTEVLLVAKLQHRNLV